MKKRQAILLLFLAIAAGCAFFLKGYMEKNVVVLKTGTVIAVDGIWESADVIFYEIENEVFLLNKSEVESFGEPDIKFIWRQIKRALLGFFVKSNAELKSFTDSTATSINQNLLLIVFILAATLLCITILLLVRARIAITNRRKKPTTDNPSADIEASFDECQQDSITRSDITKYFLTLFRLQLGADPDTPMNFKLLSSKSSGSNYIYELRIKHCGDWVRRRMTIGPLGEESGSKSKCFYVIYDEHLVIKIPALPVVEFDEYIKSIKKEREIVDKLAPKECVIPKVSVVLDLIHKLPESSNLPADKREEKYVAWLRRNTDFQEYLKIKNTFVFFMDFSKYYFLGNIIDNLHDVKDSIPAEIIENSETIWDVTKFRGRYGKAKESVCFEIRQVYNNCQAAMRKFLTDSGVSSDVSLFQIQSWFLAHLAGKEVCLKEGGGGLPENLVRELNRLIRKILKDHGDAVKAYRNTIKEYVHKIRFEQNKPQMAGIITNLLELLVWLRIKRVAMRDLKPDNLLVAGDPAKYPLFLMDANEYQLGIIDVETAVDFEKSKYRKIKQPLLGGTPFYATPSHFFNNDVLSLAFNNLSKILHLQDWHATVVMIFKTSTGNLLFEQTAKLFGDIRDIIKTGQMEGRLDTEVVEDASRTFWRSALIEFQVKMGQKEKALKSISVVIPENVKGLFKKALAIDISSIAERIKRLIDTQRLFESSQSRGFLLHSSSEKIHNLKAELENKVKSSRNPSGNHAETVKFLQDLTHLKIDADQQKQLLKRLDQPDSKISAYALLDFMFNTVIKSMYKEDWKALSAGDNASSAEIDNTPLEATA